MPLPLRSLVVVPAAAAVLLLAVPAAFAASLQAVFEQVARHVREVEVLDAAGLFDEGGHLVGVIRYRKLADQNVNFAAPAAWIAEISERAAAQGELRDWRRQAIVALEQSLNPAAASELRVRLAALPGGKAMPLPE